MSAPPIIDRHKMQFHRQAPIKELVRAATTANITISTALNNGDTLDGVTLATGDRVLVKDQSTASQNGIYVVGATPVRDYDLSTDDAGFGYLVVVIQGTANAGTIWRNTNTSAPTVGSTSITFSQFSGGVPAGAITTSGLTMSTARLLGRTTASTGAIEEITVGTGLSLSAGSLTATGGGTGTVDTAKDGSTTVTDPDTIKITGTGGITVSLSESPSGTALYSVDGSGVTGSGTSGYDLDTYSIDGTYGDDFTGASLSGSWTRRNFTSGAESYQQGKEATYISIVLSGRSAGDGYFRTAPGGDWTFAMAFTTQSSSHTSHWGLMVVDTNGTGVGFAIYQGAPTNTPLIQSITTYTTSSGTYYEPILGSSGSPNVALNAATMVKTWLYLRKSGTNYYCAYSLDGEAWSPEGGPLAWAGTVDRVAMGMVALASTSVATGATVVVDWFNKIA